MRTWIDSILPEAFFLRQGKYLQTCAYIEKMLWLIYLESDDVDASNAKQFEDALKKRKTTSSLREALRKAIKNDSLPYPEQLTPILDHIDREIHGRHMAAHGAWTDNQDGSFNCEYFFKPERGKEETGWTVFPRPLTEGELDQALIAVDEILGRTIKLWDKIKRR